LNFVIGSKNRDNDAHAFHQSAFSIIKTITTYAKMTACSPRRLVFIISALGLLYSSCCLEESTCDANGVCTTADPKNTIVEPSETRCFSNQNTFCGPDDMDHSTTTKTTSQHHGHSLYRNGGTAQAYKSNAPIGPFICDVADQSSSSLRVATWPFSRSSWKQAPQITLTVNLWKDCSSQISSSDDDADGNCCCQPWMQNATVEAWQARPDGTYSSLRSGVQEGDCRTRMHFVSSSVVLQTLAPGSTGSLGGLGPSGWDTAPYGPPVIHLLITSKNGGYAPILMDLPMLLDYNKKTLQPVRFRWSDWRGRAWAATATGAGKHVNNDGVNQEYAISSWVTDVAKKQVNVTVDVVLFKIKQDDGAGGGNYTKTSPQFCQSLLPIYPSSFFLEPITECAPSMLDFFAL
jgi:hypothetical protein